MIVSDSSVWIDYFNGRLTPQTRFLLGSFGQRQILVGDLILLEVLQGFREDAELSRAKAEFDNFPFAPMVGRDIALKAAENYRALRGRGVTPRKTIDVIIATFCIERGHHLLHAYRDFGPMETHLGLKSA